MRDPFNRPDEAVYAKAPTGGTLDDLITAATADPPRERDRVLAEAGAAISGDRERDYGSARDGFARTGAIWGAILDRDPFTAEQVALMLAALKVSRLASNTGHRDSWVDMAGYAALGADIAAETAADYADIDPFKVVR